MKPLSRAKKRKGRRSERFDIEKSGQEESEEEEVVRCGSGSVMGARG